MSAGPQGRAWLIILAVLAALTWAGSTHAQGLPTRSSMPDPVVLVVKRVADDAVVPTTGVVAGRTRAGVSLVVIPASFLDDENPIFVMDFGTDLLLDGLPAEPYRLSPDSDLAVIAVEGMQRRPIRVTFNPPEVAHEVRLAAWPPTDMMAAGAPPYWIPVDVAGKRTGEPQELVANASVPSFTGPLIDLCGQWVGMVLAGRTSDSGSEIPSRVILNDELLRLSELLELDLQLESCAQVAPAGGIVQTAPPAGVSSYEPTTAGNMSAIERLAKDANIGIGALVFLLSAIISGILFWYLVKRRAAAQRRRKIQRSLATETMTFSASGLPTRMTREDPKTFNPPSRPPGTNGWLGIVGTHADGRPLRAVTAITEGKFQAVIGRAGVALSADGPGISRKHAVIVSEGGRLTISDLGSRNGTFVNGVRCQPDEVFYIEPGDKVLLGAAEVTLTLKPATDSGK